MIDLDWIIEQENELTKKAKQNFGSYFNLSLDLLDLLQSIASFSNKNEVAHFFEIHTFESLVLFVYSMEHMYEIDYRVEREEKQIVEFDESLKNKAYQFIEKKYPEDSKMIEGFKGVVNIYYSHANIFSSQYNAAIIEGRIKGLIFDSYFDEYIIDMLCCINEMLCFTLSLYEKLQNDYKLFEFEKHFAIRLKAFSNRSKTLYIENCNNNQQRVNFPDVEKLVKKLDEKYGVENKNPDNNVENE